MAVLRVLSYNVRSLRDDVDALVRVVRACRPDVLCLQEAPRLWRWRSRRRRFARAVGLAPVVNRRVGGLAILAAPDVRVVRTAHHRLTYHLGLHVRAVSIAVVEVAGRRVALATTHLDLHQGARLQHAAEVVERLAAVTGDGVDPVLTGDINEEADGPAWRLLASGMVDTGATVPRGGEMTFTARRPRKRIDAIFTGPGLRPVGAGVPLELVSEADLELATDHRPLLAEIAL
ncbi:endonuclease/exonuclease/phosphatase family protein [Marinactinospora endophytica]